MGSLHGGLQLFEVDASMKTDISIFLPRKLGPLKAYPNPFNGELSISVEVKSPGSINLSVYNLLGEKLQTIINSPLNVGAHKFSWHSNNLSSGIYILMATTSRVGESQERLIQKIVNIK